MKSSENEVKKKSRVEKFGAFKNRKYLNTSEVVSA